MLRRHIVLLIVIRLSDGDVKPGGPLVLISRSRLCADTWFHLLPSFHHHPVQHNYTTQTVTHTVTLTSSFSRTLYRYSSHTNVFCTSGAWFENRPHLTPSIHLAWNPKHVIVQWVGIGTHTHTNNFVSVCILYLASYDNQWCQVAILIYQFNYALYIDLCSELTTIDSILRD